MWKRKNQQYDKTSKDDKTLFNPEAAFKNSHAAVFCCLNDQTAIVPLLFSLEGKQQRELIEHND